MNRELILAKDAPATLIPQGEATVLKSGMHVFVTQTLGGNVTVRTDSGLFRIAREHTDALGPDFKLEDQTVSEGSEQTAFSEEAVWGALRTCFDPEIPINIVDLGLIYDLAIEPAPDGRNSVEVKMTLTAQGCGMGPVIAEDARSKIAALPEVASAKVHIVWDPVWTPQMISDDGRKILGLE